MKIGFIAMNHSRSRIDADKVREEGDFLLQNLSHALDQHQQQFADKITGSLREYFDPDSGRFNERVKLLVGQDGELERIIRAQVEGEASPIAQTLAAHAGKDSLFMRILDPKYPEGVVPS